MPWAAAAALSVLLLLPALRPGYLLVYDMVWVPHLALDRDVLGWGSALPRAVPSDAVVAVLDNVVPAMLLQRIALFGALLLAAGGALRLVSRGLVPRLVAVVLVVWNPFVSERLAIGHWPLLLGYAAVPWLADAGRQTHGSGRVPWRVYPLLVVGSLSANAAIVSVATLLATGWRRGRLRTNLLMAGAGVLFSLPWIVTGLRHASAATSASGYDLFAAHGDELPAPLSLLTLGGIWNRQVVPGSLLGVTAWLLLLLVVGLAVLGWRRWRASVGRRQAVALVVLWVAGYAIALLSWLVPSWLGWIGGHVPGAGLLRDGSRSLALCVPLFVSLLVAGVVEAVEGARAAGAKAVLTGVAVLLPVALLPDAGIQHVQPTTGVEYPQEWADVRALIGDDGGGTVLLLPYSAYRAPAWNGGVPVLDPLGRYLEQPYVASDDLIVDDAVIAGEDPHAADVRAALTAGLGPDELARRLAALGIRWVVTEKDAPVDAYGPAPLLAGTVLHDGNLLEVARMP